MKNTKRNLLLMLLVMFLLSAVACPPPVDDTVYHTVSYCFDNDHDGVFDTVSETKRVADGATAKIFSVDPLGHAYRQGEWCTVGEDGKVGEVYDVNAPVKGDLTLMVKWEENKFSVTYMLGGPYVSVNVPYGNKASNKTIEELTALLPTPMQEDVNTWLATQTEGGKVFLYWEYEKLPWDFEEYTVITHITLNPVFGIPTQE